MEREKMIEEIAKKVCIACGKCKELKADCYLARNIASVMIDDGYQKVTDGAVVLTKEEYERLASYISEERAREIFHKETEKLKEKIRRETAREIIKDLIGHRFAHYEVDEKHGTYRLLSDYVVDKEDVNFFEDKYGVEVEE